MRDPNRIPEVLARIERVWRRFPDLRLGQLISNAVYCDPFHIEDERLVDLLERYAAVDHHFPLGEHGHKVRQRKKS